MHSEIHGKNASNTTAAPWDYNLSGKVCIITGGAGIIGSALAEELARVGVKIILLDILKDAVETVAERISRRHPQTAIGLQADVLNRESLLNVRGAIEAAIGSPQILINCVGGNIPLATTKNEFLTPDNLNDISSSFFGLKESSFQAIFDLNYMATVLPILVFAEEMAKDNDGVILNISSLNAFRPSTRTPAYSSAKASINNLTQWLAVHFAKVHIRVNAVAPGFLITGHNQALLIDKKTHHFTERGEKIIAGTPLGRFGEIDDLFGAVLFLISDASKYVTGVVLPVDGGCNAFSGV